MARTQQLRPPLPRAVLLVEETIAAPAAPVAGKNPAAKVPEPAPAVQAAVPATAPEKATQTAPAGSATVQPPRHPVANGLSRASGRLDLSAIMEHVEQKASEEASLTESVQPLSLEEVIVLELWNTLIVRLRQAEKIQVATNLEMSEVSVSGPEEVLITCRNELVKNFVDDEKPAFSETLKERFRNQGIVVASRVDDSLRQKEKGPRVLSQREQFEQMMEKYPLVRTLKENLHLDLG